MNRQQRRAMEKQYRLLGKKTPDVSQARADGRPQYYDITEGDRVQCVTCVANGVTAQYGRGEAFINDPANSPVLDRKTKKPDGGVFTVCKGHIPENAVIFDPMSDQCRNKAGDNTWTEKA